MLNLGIRLYLVLITALLISTIAYLVSYSYAYDSMILVPAGKFLMGSSKDDGKVGKSVGVDEIPQHSVYVEAFYIDKYEVSNREYKIFIEKAKHSPPENTPDKEYYSWKGDTIPEGQEDLPVTNVNWYDADAYCRWAGKRLPSEAEWEKAARGEDGRQWPWGNDLKVDSCNTKYSSAGMLLPVGSLSGDLSPYSVYDMCGNVAEWTASFYLPYPGSTLKRDSFGDKFKVARGGSWVMPAFPYSRVSYRANNYKPEYRHRGIGFRCVKDVDENPEHRNKK